MSRTYIDNYYTVFVVNNHLIIYVKTAQQSEVTPLNVIAEVFCSLVSCMKSSNKKKIKSMLVVKITETIVNNQINFVDQFFGLIVKIEKYFLFHVYNVETKII